ncbi:MAG: FtsH protease activity modulator HflK [Luteimonas sp.]
MAWNIPGKNNSGDRSGKDGREGSKQRNGEGGNGAFGELRDRFRGVFGDDGGPLRWVGLLLALWLAFSSFVLITEQQRGVVLRFGQFSRVLQPGPHFKFPWPVEGVTKVNATAINNFSQTFPVLTRDENIVSVEVNVQYRINDAQRYLFGTRNAVEVLEQAALSAVREQVGQNNLDTVLSARGALAVAAKARLQSALDTYHTGLSVTGLSLPNARPPEEVKPAFDDVNSAQQDKDRRISVALAYAAKVVPEARGQASQVRTAAQGYQTAAVARATGDAQRFTLLQQQYAAAPEVTRKRLWLETVQQVLAGNRKVIGGDGRQIIYVPMGGASGNNNASSMQPPIAPDLIAPTVTAAPPSDMPRPTRPTGRDEGSR